MINCFKYVEIPEEHAVSLRLFLADDGNAQGDVTGPKLGYSFEVAKSVVELVHCTSLDDAFAAGIRMANENDADLIISGNPDLWLSKWGTLEQPASIPFPLARALP